MQRRQGYLEGGDLRITWCVGHLVELEDPAHYDERWKRWSFETLPMLPQTFALRARAGARDQWQVVRKLLREKDVDDVVNACDAGREGELIFRYVYQLAGCKHAVKRFWVSSMTDAAIKSAWANLRSGADFDTLGDAARCRSEADWLVGLNATRAMTCLARRGADAELLSIGRVQTPTLAMIVNRDLAIESFVVESFWQVKANFEVPRDEGDPAKWTGTWFKAADKAPAAKAKSEGGAGSDVPNAERLADEATAKAIAACALGKQGTVAAAGSRTKKEPPPLLHDLTSLQRRANQRYGFSADHTLNIAQALYEKHKLITYPRTDARYLTPDQVPELADVVRAVATLGPYSAAANTILAAPINPGKRVVDASEVGDHHALLPTTRRPQSGSLSADEKRIYDLVARRLLAALSADAIFQLTELLVLMDVDEGLPEGVSSPLHFRAKGRVCTQEGWRSIDPPLTKKKSLDLPKLAQGELATAVDCKAPEGKTRPPRPHNDASLLRSMETAGRNLQDSELKRAMRSAGLGTPATRANILKTLLTRKYIERKKRDILSTRRGRALIAAVPLDELKSAELTGRWEARLANVAEGKDNREAFIADVSAHVREIVSAIDAADPPPAELVAKEAGKQIGSCPVCEKPVRDRGMVWSCDTGRSCSFVIFKKVAKRPVSKRMVVQLLTEGKTAVLKGFKSRKGKAFDAALMLKEDGTVGFSFPPRENSGGYGGHTSGPVGQPCPKCNIGSLIRGKAAFGCNRWREGCDYRQPF